MPRWFVLYCKQGFRYHDRLSSIGVEVFYPVYVEIERRKTGIQVSDMKKLCPGYIFIKTDFSGITPASILSVPGVIQFLKFDDSFYQVPDVIINSLLGVSTGSQNFSLEINEIAFSRTREEREVKFLHFLKKHQYADQQQTNRSIH